MSTESDVAFIEGLRARARNVALAHAGASAKGARAAEYADFLFPNDTPSARRAFALSMSSCALFALAVWRAVGVPHHDLAAPYASRLGRAVADVVGIGQDASAYEAANEAARVVQPLAAGDAIVMGPAEHVALVVGVESWGGITVYRTVDGGQGGPAAAGGYAIAEGAYIIDDRHPSGRLWVESVHAPAYSIARPSAGRALIGTVSLGLLATSLGMCPPDGAS